MLVAEVFVSTSFVALIVQFAIVICFCNKFMSFFWNTRQLKQIGIMSIYFLPLKKHLHCMPQIYYILMFFVKCNAFFSRISFTDNGMCSFCE